ncbi:hypothetical protein [Spongiactinospora rosea]|uniref:hypothetical protein n=1 Tax=Spongiactinospora rosea TaxID=2248750 RepID=UPI001314CB20|nr:hypothetical protein [Spongiactinospora rosea]
MTWGAVFGAGPRGNARVSIAFGAFAGTYLCRTVTIEPLAPGGQLKAGGCVLL